MDRKKKAMAWTIWLITFPLGFWLAYTISPPQMSLYTLDFLVFVLLLLACALLPIVINDITMSVTQWINLVVFLKYGLFAEMLLAQLLILVIMALRNPKGMVFTRFALNSTMFIFVSLFSGLLFYSLDGTHGIHSINDPFFWGITAVYVVAYFLINQGILQLFYYVFFQTKRPLLTPATKWEFLTTIIVFPIGIILYFLHASIGLIALLLVGVPVVMMLFILRIYNSTREMNLRLQKIVEFSHLLTARLNKKEIMDLFCENLVKMFPVDSIYIFEQACDEHLQLTRAYEFGEYKDFDLPLIQKDDVIAGKMWTEGKPVLFSEKGEWRENTKMQFPEEAESLLAIPMEKNNEITGLILLTSRKKRAYEKFHLMLIDILCSYLAIAFDNARHYEKTKYQSERDPLTNLYNARVISDRIEDAFTKLHEGQIKTLALLMVDIDHFKAVNDTYGHESGNVVLQQVANLLGKIVGNKGILGRYGGEEFTILLFDYTKKQAIDFAEYIRKTIEEYTFTLYDDLAEVRRKINIHLTVSIGVAVVPDDTEEMMELIRVADRALYLGAKQIGRNKVAEYER